MTTVNVTPQAYELIVSQAQKTQRSPDEVASQMITAYATATEHPYIERKAEVLGGKPVIKGTRIAVWISNSSNSANS